MSTHWTDEETATLERLWLTAGSIKRDIAPHLPGRSYLAIRTKACIHGLGPLPNAKREHLCFSKLAIVDFLTKRPKSDTHQIAEGCGLTYDATKQLLRKYHKTSDFYIAAYFRGRGRRYRTKLWCVGPGKDAKKPPKLTEAEICKRYRRAMKRDPAAYPFGVERKRSTRGTTKPVRRDPLAAALFGEAA